MRSFAVRVSPDGATWLVEIAGIGATQARRLDDVERMARDYIRIMTGGAPEGIELDVHIEAHAGEGG